MSNTTSDDLLPTTRDDEEEADASMALIFITTAVVGLWCLAITISTKGCRDCKHRERYYSDDNVWMPTRLRDYRLALQLQREEAEAARVEATAQRQRQEQARKAWVERAVEKQDPIVIDTRNIGKYHSCAICLAEYAVNAVLLKGDHCAHAFHKECIAGALLRSRACPVCRQIFLTQDAKQENTAETQGDLEITSSAAGVPTPPTGNNHENDDNNDSTTDNDVESGQ